MEAFELAADTTSEDDESTDDSQESCQDDPNASRVQEGTMALQAAAVHCAGVPDSLVGYMCTQVAGDGFCFFRVMEHQWGLSLSCDERTLACTAILCALNMTSILAGAVEEEFTEERLVRLAEAGVEGESISCCVQPAMLDMCVWLLDQCLGLVDDAGWSLRARYADSVLIDAFCQELGLTCLVIPVPDFKNCISIGPDREMPHAVVLHYHETTFEHFNSVSNAFGKPWYPDQAKLQELHMRINEIWSCWPKLHMGMLNWQWLVEAVLGSFCEDGNSTASSDCSGEDGPASESLPKKARTGASGGESVFNVEAMVSGMFVMAASPHPRARYEQKRDALAKLIKQNPTVGLSPWGSDWSQAALDSAVSMPLRHCVFSGCRWHGSTLAEQLGHICSEHLCPEVEAAVDALDRADSSFEVRVFTVVNDAVAAVSRNSPPIASFSHDRRALLAHHGALHAGVEGLVCTLCACVHPWIGGCEIQQKIEWRQCDPTASGSLHCNQFLGLQPKQVDDFFGLTGYFAQYGCVGQGHPNLLESPWLEEFGDWFCKIPLQGRSVAILCCPEDRRCANQHDNCDQLCPSCFIPVCCECWSDVTAEPPRQPARVLANDGWTGYASELIYRHAASYLEVMLASPCVLSLVSFILEVHRGNALSEPAHMQRYRIGPSAFF